MLAFVVCCAALLKVDNMLDVEVEDEVRTRQRVCRWPTGQERGDQWGPPKDVAKDGGE